MLRRPIRLFSHARPWLSFLPEESKKRFAVTMTVSSVASWSFNAVSDLKRRIRESRCREREKIPLCIHGGFPPETRLA